MGLLAAALISPLIKAVAAPASGPPRQAAQIVPSESRYSGIFRAEVSQPPVIFKAAAKGSKAHVFASRRIGALFSHFSAWPPAMCNNGAGAHGKVVNGKKI